MERWIQDPTNPHSAEGMLRTLAASCNHASSHDGSGFSKNDAAFGHSLAQQSHRGWTPKQAEAALRLITKYSGQLGGKDFISSWMQNPNFEKLPALSKKVTRRMYLDGDVAVIAFAYDPEVLSALKADFVPGDRIKKAVRPVFDPATRTWRVRISDIAAIKLKELANRYGFEMDSALSDRLERTLETTINSRTMLALNDGRHIVMAGDTITIAVDSTEILTEFEMELGCK